MEGQGDVLDVEEQFYERGSEGQDLELRGANPAFQGYQRVSVFLRLQCALGVFCGR